MRPSCDRSIGLATEVMKWSPLGKEAIIALIGGVGVVGAFGLIVIGMARHEQARRSGRPGAAAATASLAAIGGLICVAAVVFGIIAMTHTS
jgi:hypothetical protein